MIMNSPITSWATKSHGPKLSPKCYVASNAMVIGPVEISNYVMVGPGASIRGDEGCSVYIGTKSNVQDNVIMHGLKEKCVNVKGHEYSVYISEEVSCAHGCIIHGPAYIGPNTFIGFNSIIHSSKIGAKCFIGHGARIIGVNIPDGKYVPHGAVVDNEESVAKLGPIPDALKHFNEEVIAVNVELAIGYNKQRIPVSMPRKAWLMKRA